MICDCFLFFDELELLDIRLNYLDPIVDRFVIVESTRTFSSRDKPLVFQQNQKSFSKFAHKIKHIVVDDFSSSNAWENERYQRDCVSRGLTDCAKDDLIVLSDCDEIPRIEALQKTSVSEFSLIGCDQTMYYYYLNGLLSNPWVGTKLFRFSLLQQNLASKLRDTCVNASAIVLNAGWHFSYLGGSERVARKIRAFSHQEFNKPEFTDLKKIEERMKKAEDLFARGTATMTWVKIDDSYPSYVRENLGRFQHLIHEGV